VLQGLVELFDISIQKFFLTAEVFLENFNKLDEAKTFNKLLSVNFQRQKKTYIFLGFKYLNLVQIDFLEHFARFNDVFIFFPKGVYENREGVDWIDWVKFDDVEILQSQSKELAEGLKIAEHDYHHFLKNKSGAFLFNLSSRTESITALKFGGSLNFSKEAVSLLEGEFEQLRDDLFLLFVQKQSQEELSQYLKEQLDSAVEKKLFLRVKCIILFNEVLKETLSYSNEKYVEVFDLNLILEMTALNAPRVNFITRSENLSILPFGALNYGIAGDFNFAVIDSSFLRPKKSYSLMDAELIQALYSIGVVKRDGFELLFRVHALEGFLAAKNNCILYSDEKILEGFDFVAAKVEESALRKNKIPEFVSKAKKPVEFNPKKFSPSGLQTFYDCSYKYWAKYINKSLTTKDHLNEVSSLEKGRLEHQLIEEIVSENIKASEMQGHIQGRFDLFYGQNKRLDFFERESILFDLEKKVRSGVVFCNEILRKYPDAIFEFEKEVNDENFYGKADLIVISDAFKGVFDFKRSSFGIPSRAEVFNIDSFQVLSYLSRFGFESFGYVCLADLEKSLLFSSSKFEINMLRFQIASTVDLIPKYLEKENIIRNEITSTDSFLAIARKKDLCTFCELNNTCVKSNES
jgi:hypothetical protein